MLLEVPRDKVKLYGPNTVLARLLLRLIHGAGYDVVPELRGREGEIHAVWKGQTFTREDQIRIVFGLKPRPQQLQ